MPLIFGKSLIHPSREASHPKSPNQTGNEKWVYNDNVNSPMIQEWLGSIVDKKDMTRHDKWLCMMMPRLKLLRELLSEDGVIFISIDDNEMHRLKLICDEIFGEDRFIATINWRKLYSTQMDSTLGNGFQEVIYERCLAIEMEKLGLGFARELEMTIHCEGIDVGTRRVDFLIEDCIMVSKNILTACYQE